MPRIRSQLAVQVEPALLQRLRAHADATGRTMSALVGEAVEALLAGGHGTPRHGMADADLLARIEALELQVAQLVSPARVITTPELQVESTETIGVPALAALLGISTKAISKWASDHEPGAVRDGWRLLGKVPANGPGVPRWAFERVVG
jgi:hypothetical protein